MIMDWIRRRLLRTAPVPIEEPHVTELSECHRESSEEERILTDEERKEIAKREHDQLQYLHVLEWKADVRAGGRDK